MSNYTEGVLSLLREIGQDYPRCGFTIGAGWFPIVSAALWCMAAHKGWRLEQVKSKFCGLRIYYDVLDDAPAGLMGVLDEIIKEAEALCAVACEHCGQPHGLSTPGIGIALCPTCKG